MLCLTDQVSRYFGCLLFVLCCFFYTEGNEKSQKWSMQDWCGQQLEAHGGELHFDSQVSGGRACALELVGLGPVDTMWSIYFSAFNVTGSCAANVTIKEPGATPFVSGHDKRGLYASFCQSEKGLTSYTMFTTVGNRLLVEFTPNTAHSLYRALPRASTVKFTLSMAAFTIRPHGCTELGDADGGSLYSCKTGRCVHESVVCQDLNPCGDFSDCDKEGHAASQGPTGGEVGTEEQGTGFVTVALVVVGVVFGMFALIQIMLVLSNGRTGGHDGGAIEDEVVFIETSR
ncbi:hypothetical protein MAR_027481 [Mya arenaria]|uniref:CUB domain-containing protein n=1 Tax=Mya arenaria TaxID=6604 RepID=A0ABY7F1S6_MYAAR|nr:hypothetical protein MAR_027481 [Mya arenaria]